MDSDDVNDEGRIREIDTRQARSSSERVRNFWLFRQLGGGIKGAVVSDVYDMIACRK